MRCFMCNKHFKKDDFVMVTDGNYEESTHEECHYDYLLNMHMNENVSFDELKEIKKDIENQD